MAQLETKCNLVSGELCDMTTLKVGPSTKPGGSFLELCKLVPGFGLPWGELQEAEHLGMETPFVQMRFSREAHQMQI